MISGASDLAAARWFTARKLQEWGAGELGDIAVLLVSETVTNALLHAGTDARLTLCFEGGMLRVEVSDGSVELPMVRSYSVTAVTGRGLMLVDTLAERWGVLPNRDGKTVWFELTTESRSGGRNGRRRSDRTVRGRDDRASPPTSGPGSLLQAFAGAIAF